MEVSIRMACRPESSIRSLGMLGDRECDFAHKAEAPHPARGVLEAAGGIL